MNRSTKRLVAGFGLLLLIAALTVVVSTSAFAFNVTSDQPNTANGGSPANATGSLSALSIRPASSETFVASYTFGTYNVSSAAAGFTTANASPIRYMWQQWRHNQSNEWFYLYAQNINENAGASISATPSWAFYYYTRARGATLVATGVGNGTAAVRNAAASPLLVSTIYLDSGTGTTNPAFVIDSVTAGSRSVVTNNVSATGGNATLSSTLRWGLAMQGFMQGSMTLLQAVETFPIATSIITQPTVYYDAWESPTGAANVVTLGNANPTTTVTNASGTRVSNLGASYSITQTVSDTDGDANNASLLYVGSGSQAGRWFHTGVYLQRGNMGLNAAGAAGSSNTFSGFYEDWRTSRTTVTTGAATTVGYFTRLTLTPTTSTITLEGGAIGAAGITVTYETIYASSAQGTWTVFGRGEDWHGGSSGNVTGGTLTIT